ncbi:hypothetical protein KP77_17320 [Jeotgalibacillus alimentarius]|uniref:Uncharacterized protein n=1 Tax=Jeotgalibacillus alimentarius TaxID=135826 RepID=A0A0C2VN62_9BACL|nr:hypothetical protein [Jeotgalibacillus alimentarius]KIL50357.1 hypothetical protein KP77_17320 [Jeotgalibacillus alimentarius]
MHIAVIVLVIVLLIVYFLPAREQKVDIKDEGWIVAAIVTALAAYGAIELAKQEELKELTLDELKNELDQFEDLPDIDMIVENMGIEAAIPDFYDMG